MDRNARAAAHVDGPKLYSLRMLAFAAFAGVLGTDLVSKAWAEAALRDSVCIVDWLCLILHRNSGLFLGRVPLFSGYWVCICVAVGWFGWRALSNTSEPIAVSLAVVVAGVVGNTIGQAQGAVVDFIGIGPITGNDQWLVMNVADLALVGGGLALGYFLIRDRMRRARHPMSTTESPPRRFFWRNGRSAPVGGSVPATQRDTPRGTGDGTRGF